MSVRYIVSMASHTQTLLSNQTIYGTLDEFSQHVDLLTTIIM